MGLFDLHYLQGIVTIAGWSSQTVFTCGEPRLWSKSSKAIPKTSTGKACGSSPPCWESCSSTDYCGCLLCESAICAPRVARQVLAIAAIFCQGSPVFSPVWGPACPKLDASPKLDVAEGCPVPRGPPKATTHSRLFDVPVKSLV